MEAGPRLRLDMESLKVEVQVSTVEDSCLCIGGGFWIVVIVFVAGGRVSIEHLHAGLGAAESAIPRVISKLPRPDRSSGATCRIHVLRTKNIPQTAAIKSTIW